MNSVQRIRAQIDALGPILPGSLDSFYSVCGKPRCRCRDENNPKKHGPYYRLSYSLRGKNSSLFVKKDEAEIVQQMTADYRKLRGLTLELGLATLESVRRRGVCRTIQQSTDTDGAGMAGDSWKERCRKKSRKLKAAEVAIRDLRAGRDRWKEKHQNMKDECAKLQKKVAASEKRIHALELAVENGEKK